MCHSHRQREYTDMKEHRQPEGADAFWQSRNGERTHELTLTPKAAVGSMAAFTAEISVNSVAATALEVATISEVTARPDTIQIESKRLSFRSRPGLPEEGS